MEKNFSLKCNIIDKGLEWRYKNKTYKHLNLCLHSIHERIERHYKKNYVCSNIKFSGDFIITTSQIHICKITYENFKYIVSFSDSTKAGYDLYKILMDYIYKKKYKEYEIDFDEIEGILTFNEFKSSNNVHLDQTITNHERALDYAECSLEIT